MDCQVSSSDSQFTNHMIFIASHLMHFPLNLHICKDRFSNSVYLIELMWRLNETIHGQLLEQWLPHGDCSVSTNCYYYCYFFLLLQCMVIKCTPLPHIQWVTMDKLLFVKWEWKQYLPCRIFVRTKGDDACVTLLHAEVWQMGQCSFPSVRVEMCLLERYWVPSRVL